MSFPSWSPLQVKIPPVTSDWPLMNFVALVMQISAPSSRGFWNTGAIIELSTHTRAPFLCAMAAMDSISVICRRGFVGDSLRLDKKKVSRVRVSSTGL